MNAEFTRKELYDLVWSRPMKTIAAEFGISDVALAKQCKKASIPVPTRGYWARKQAGQLIPQTALPPRFPGTSDLIGGQKHRGYYWGSNWPEKMLELPVPPIPVFEEELSDVENRARRLVGRVRCSDAFKLTHHLVAKLLEQDEKRKRDFQKWRSSLYTPKYETGIERRRLCIINTLFLAAANLGCRSTMSTSEYVQDSQRHPSITVGETTICFEIEVINPNKSNERLRLRFYDKTDGKSEDKCWEDKGRRKIEYQLTDIFVMMLVEAERRYRQFLNRYRERIIESKFEAEAELKRRHEEAERRERELREKEARENRMKLLREVKALHQANQIRAYVQAVLGRAAEIPSSLALDKWATWANEQADKIDPIKNGSIMRAAASDKT